MATGRLGASDVGATTNTTVYTCPAETYAVVSLNICNRGTSSAAIRIALSATGTVAQDRTFVVTVAANNQSPGQNVYVIDGAQYPDLQFVVGSTYTFNQNDVSNNGHPINFSITQAGTHQGGVAFVDNVRYYLDDVLVADPEAYNAGFNTAVTRHVEITVTSATPNTLYYYCYNHPVMAENAVINVVSVGTPTDAEYIEYDTIIFAKNVLERTGIVLAAGQRIVAYSSTANISAVAVGIETLA